MGWGRIREMIGCMGEEFRRNIETVPEAISSRNERNPPKVLRHVPFNFHIDETFGSVGKEGHGDRINAVFSFIET